MARTWLRHVGREYQAFDQMRDIEPHVAEWHYSALERLYYGRRCREIFGLYIFWVQAPGPRSG
jgi:hypothetical protein